MLRVSILAAGLLAVAAVVVVFGTDLLHKEVWTRDTPLSNPIAVTQVSEGVLTLADGRTLRPAGVRRSDGVTPDEYDLALRTLVAQGVLVDRTLDDTRAMLTAEPKFYNWCGTRGMEGNPFAHWAGGYYPCPVSEFLIIARYADPDPDQPGLTPCERWRLEGTQHFWPPLEDPQRQITRPELTAFRYEGYERLLADYDSWLEIAWRSPPPGD
ncbi:MAG: hypothetical protein IPJ41_04690 [Phycisphaerales bacterium]|nr:hypothetical protein [Phycisphaerales bacterium]